MDEPAACKLKGKSGVSNLIPRERFQTSTKKTAKEVDFEPAYAKQRAERCFVPHFAKQR